MPGIAAPRNDRRRRYDLVLGVQCLCNSGVQECPIHPGRLRTKEQNIAFRKAWDARCLGGEAP